MDGEKSAFQPPRGSNRIKDPSTKWTKSIQVVRNDSLLATQESLPGWVYMVVEETVRGITFTEWMHSRSQNGDRRGGGHKPLRRPGKRSDSLKESPLFPEPKESSARTSGSSCLTACPVCFCGSVLPLFALIDLAPVLNSSYWVALKFFSHHSTEEPVSSGYSSDIL